MLNQLTQDFASLSERVAMLERGTMLDLLKSQYKALGARVSALESIPRTRVKASDFELIGGWRIARPFARGGLAVDLKNNRLFTAGDTHEGVIYEYRLQTLGTGSNVNSWPILTAIKKHSNFWGEEQGGWGHGYPTGIHVEADVLWVSSRVYYETVPKTLTVYGKHLVTGEKHKIETKLQQPAFGGGFIKGNQSLMLGCGGYESGQGATYGPTLAKLDSTILINQPTLSNGTWDNRTPRPPNYSIVSGNPDWLGLNPRNGEGRWCSDRIYGGGIWRDRGLCYWALLGTGQLSYAYQSEMFSIDDNKECWLYTYDPVTYAKSSLQFERWPHGMVHGCDVVDGNIYLNTRDQWISGLYKVDPVIKVFRVNK